MKSAVDLINEAANDFCNNYCKFPEQYEARFKDPDEAAGGNGKENNATFVRCRNCFKNNL